MSNVKEKMVEVIVAQPEDATYVEILRELAFERMIERCRADSYSGHVISKFLTMTWNAGFAHGGNKVDRGSAPLAAR